MLSPLTLTMLQSGLMKGTSILPITKVLGKHAIPRQITGGYVQTVYFRPISCFWYNRFRGKS